MSLATYDGMVMTTLLACTETTPSGVSYTNAYPLLSDFVMLISFHESLTLLPKLDVMAFGSMARPFLKDATVCPFGFGRRLQDAITD
uniref:PPOC n=1 Tax=Arundo donax TaxID=35708 RepID=A0A0A9CQE3_ARUDO